MGFNYAFKGLNQVSGSAGNSDIVLSTLTVYRRSADCFI